MAKDHRRLDAQLVQEVLLDDPSFLREIVERVVQQILEAEMTEHLDAAPYERVEGRTGQRNGYKPRALRTRVGTLNLLVPQREGARFGLDGDVHRGCLNQKGQGHYRGSLRYLLLQEPRLFSGRFPRLGAKSVEDAPTRNEGLPLPVCGRPLREGESRWEGGEPGGPHRLG
jgi:Transposase, Mutator family